MTAKVAKLRGMPEQGAPRKVSVATAPEREAHHATLREVQCTDCAVGLLRQYVSASLRSQRKVDLVHRRFHLRGDEELELSRTTPLALQLVGLRREGGISEGCEDLLLVLYDPALLVDADRPVLDAEGLREENVRDAQEYVDMVLADPVHSPPRGWPFPGVDVSCPKCKHWRVAVFPMTTETACGGTDACVSEIAPGIYNAHFRIAPHEGDSSSPVLSLAEDAIPVRRRHPTAELLGTASSVTFLPPGARDTGEEARQVFRSQEDFETFLRLAMLSKRALCPTRKASCAVASGCSTRTQGLEPCDSGACGFRFDYVQAETTRANLETLVARLGGP
ncbi:hypothetical protein [Myxococcus eversor]|uniref:hypothetical protein n=1 Tax=Myxococcus eversor TaxID=2709661 RepID=UPI0013D05AD6|nr:hypothetical protein [Myxococcus eversor]